MSEQAPIYVNDPLLVHFALQHDLRARFLEAVNDALEALSIPVPEVAARVARDILMESVDPESIGAWIAAGRPLPYIDQKVGAAAEELTEAVLALYKEKLNEDVSTTVDP